MYSWIIIFCNLAWSATLSVSLPTPSPAHEDLAIWREQSREIVKAVTCGGCHTPGLATAKEKALKVYNLDKPYWTASMSDRQLEDFKRRMKFQSTTAELKELHLARGVGVPSPEQVETVAHFIDKELQSRREDPTLRFRQLRQTKNPAFF